MSKLEETLLFQIKEIGLPIPVREYRFAAEKVGLGPGLRNRLKKAELKDWRIDLAYPDIRLAIECEGVLWKGAGRHQRGVGYENDLDKYNCLMRDGWTVYRCSQRLINNLGAVDTIKVLYNLKTKAKT